MSNDTPIPRDRLLSKIKTLEHEVFTLKQRLEDAEKGLARFEYLRKLNVHEYGNLINDCLMNDLLFDAEVDRRIEEGK